MGKWRNGIRCSLKNYWSQGRVGSTPSLPTKKLLVNKYKHKYERVLVSRIVAILGAEYITPLH